MGINFPSSPSAGQKFMSGKTLYTFTNGVWRASLGTALPYNYLVNPAFQISQENGDNFGSVNGFYPADQWWGVANVLTIGIQRFATTDPTLAPYYVQWYVPTAKPTLAAGDYTFLMQYLEGNRIRDLQWGTAAAKPVVARFTAFTTLPGTYAFSLRNAPTARSYVVPIALTGTQTVYEIPIPGDTAGTWYDANSPNANAMQWGITGASGSTYLTASPNSWQAGNFIGQTGMANLAAQSTKTIVVGRTGLYADPNGTGKAPPWEGLSFRQDKYDSQRYYQKCLAAVGIAAPNTTTHQRATYANQAPMRFIPAAGLAGTMRAWDQTNAPNITGIQGALSNRDYFEFNFTAAAVQIQGRGAMLLDTNGSTIFIAQNAR
jgi:hypothetical protein